MNPHPASPSDINYDVAVIGGGPGGAALATFLAQMTPPPPPLGSNIAKPSVPVPAGA